MVGCKSELGVNFRLYREVVEYCIQLSEDTQYTDSHKDIFYVSMSVVNSRCKGVGSLKRLLNRHQPVE